MKKLSVFILLFVCLIMTGCGSDKVKVVTTLDNFNTTLVGKNFTVTSNMNEYSNVEYIKDAMIAVLDDIQIEMIKYTDVESAEKVHENQVESFNLLKNTGAYEVKDKGSNYYRYELVSNGYFMISTRVADTLMFCKTAIENKETVDEIYIQFGY